MPTRRKKPAPGTEEEPRDAVQVKVVLDPSDGTPMYYANHFEVSMARHEFTVTAGRVPGKFSRSRFAALTENKELLLEPECQLLVAPTLMPGLIAALQTQLTAWEREFGPVRNEVPKNAH
jgi:hypothetical protein